MNKHHDNEAKTEKTPEDAVPEWETELCQQVMDEWTKGYQYNSDLNDMFDSIYSMIRGERPERNYDWQSNVVINKVFQVVWTVIPYLTNKIFSATPIIGIKSFDKDGAFEREEILEFWNTMQGTIGQERTDYFLTMVMWLLRAILNGVGINKKTWHQRLKRSVQPVTEDVPYETDEEGNITESRPVTRKVTKSIPVADWPQNEIINNKDIVYDWALKPGQSIREGRFVIHRTLTDLDDMLGSKINYLNLDAIDRTVSAIAATKYAEDHADAKSKDGQAEPPKSDIYTDVELFERIGKYTVHKVDGKLVPYVHQEDIEEDKPQTKDMIVTVARVGATHHLVRFDTNPYDGINYIDMHIYFDSERWHSTGVVEPIKDIVTAINDNINATFDEIWQNLMPPTIVNKFALWDWDTMVHAPGQKWLVGGNPREAIEFKAPTYVTKDAWQKHALLDSELQQTSVSNAIQGLGREKTATTNVMNAQMSAGKLDFVLRMVEKTALIPSAQMDIAFAKKFAHPLTFKWILGKEWNPGDWEEVYQYVPAASSVKLDEQKDAEIQQDIQLLQVVGSIQNPGVPKIQNKLMQNIFRNRGEKEMVGMLDEDHYESGTLGGDVQQITKQMNGPSNEQGIPMTGKEKAVRERAND